MKAQFFLLPGRLLEYAPTAAVAGLIISNTDALPDEPPTEGHPEPVARYLDEAVRAGWVRAELARHAAACTSDAVLLADLLTDKRITVRRAAALRCHQLGLIHLLEDLAADCEPPPPLPPLPPAVHRALYPAPAEPPTSPPDVTLDLGPVRLSDAELFRRLRRYDDGPGIAAWLASSSDDLNGFRPEVAAMLLGKFPKNQQRISSALRALPVAYYQRIDEWLGPWAMMAGPHVQDWHSRSLAQRLGSDPTRWELAIRMGPTWAGSAEELVCTVDAIVG